jgi:hypothetical protein
MANIQLKSIGEIVALVKQKADLSDEVIEKLNTMLFNATYDANTNHGMQYLSIHQEDFKTSEKVPLPLLAAILSNAGWTARYESCQRDGNFVHVDLPLIPLAKKK